MMRTRCKWLRIFIASLVGLINIPEASGQNIFPGSLHQVPAPSILVYQPSDYAGDNMVSYVRSFDVQQPMTSDAAVLAATSTTAVHQATEYYDGLGRPLETVAWQMSPDGMDIVTPRAYDNFGREQYKFLPYESGESNGLFKTLPFSSQNNFYTNTYAADFPSLSGEQIFYGQTQFELSPLNRVQQSTAPGNSWTGSGVGASVQYLVNNATDAVPAWDITFLAAGDGNNWPTTSGNYAAGTLYKTVSTDERGSEVIEYKDMEGQVVEKAVQVANVVDPSDPYTGWLVTMYVYDDQNELRVVIPPKAVDQLRLKTNNWSFTQSIIDGLCFRYEYDARKRMIGKLVPGGGWNWMVYDQRDLLVFGQTPNQAAQGQWMTTLYDVLDRPVVTGMTAYSGGQSQLQLYVTGATTSPTSSPESNSNTGVSGVAPSLTVSTRQIGVTTYQATSSIAFSPGFSSEAGASFTAQITTGAPPTTTTTATVMGNPIPSGSTFIPLTEHFYDNYTWGTTKSYSTLNSTKLDYGTNAYADPLPSPASAKIQGISTGMRIRVLEDSVNLSLGGWLETVTYYDDKGRVVQTQSDNYKGGVDTMTQRYDFTGKVVSSYLAHGNPQASTWLRVKTNNNYDGTGRLTNVIKAINDNPATQRTVAQYTYSRLGQMKTKLIGQQLSSNGTPTSTPLETQAYDYNIRGWLKGINRGYANPNLGISGGGTWFGMDIAYDWGFDSTALNGNISGIQWRSGGNGEQRAYGYSYDRANRLLYADFNQLFGSSWAKTDPGGSSGGAALNIDFSVKMGDGQTYNSAYDENGNILSMQQNGLVVNASQVIDNLSYNYGATNPGNQLQAVSDVAPVDTGAHLGDFQDGNTTGNDYNYDPNGNLLWDQNKGLNWITYDHMNLPFQIAVNPSTGAKGRITYIYDALGNKLEKRVVETADGWDGQQNTNTTTDYLGSFVYQNNVLQFFAQEEGRVRPLTNGQGQVQPSTLLYDYFLKDHLGDTRMILTEEQRTDAYPMATMEPGDSVLEDTYYANIANTRTAISGISGYPADNTTNPNYYVAAVGGLGSATHIGPSITLRVMAQDQVYIRSSSWYSGNSTRSYLPLPVANLVSALSAGLTGLAAGETGGGVIPTAGLLQPDAQNFINNQGVPNPSSPKAYLNWIFFDDQFRFVSQGSGSQQVTANSGAVNPLAPPNGYVTAPKSGYVYIYMSNADSLTTVYFDNLQVSQVHGPLTEEEHYYPFGLTMAGISSQALQFGKYNRYRYNGKEQQNKEFANGSGLEWYDYGARFYDNQIGRWSTLDPKTEDFSSGTPYSYASNNPIILIDPNGKDAVIYDDKGNKVATFHGNEMIVEKGMGRSIALAEFLSAVKHVEGKTDRYKDVFNSKSTVNVHIGSGLEDNTKAQEVVNKSNGDKSVPVIDLGNGKVGAKTVDVNWDPGQALKNTDGEAYSPAMGLFHEIIHADHLIKNYDAAENRKNQLTGDDYDDLEEQVTIQEVNSVAKQIPFEDGNRSDHRGVPYQTTGPTNRIPSIPTPIPEPIDKTRSVLPNRRHL